MVHVRSLFSKGDFLKLIDINALSELITVKPKTIYEWVRKGRIPYYKVEGLLRFDSAEIDKWLNNRHLPLQHVIKECNR